jgi:hypothetical protein
MNAQPHEAIIDYEADYGPVDGVAVRRLKRRDRAVLPAPIGPSHAVTELDEDTEIPKIESAK